MYNRYMYNFSVWLKCDLSKSLYSNLSKHAYMRKCGECMDRKKTIKLKKENEKD